MNNKILNLAKWFCRKLTANEFASIIVIFHDILAGNRSDFDFKPEIKTANYRKFYVDEEQPLLEEPPKSPKQIQPIHDWKILKNEYEIKHNKTLKTVRRRNNQLTIPNYCKCEKCGAPSEYLYLNDGKKANQIRCKICNSLSQTQRVRRESQAKYFCPHCGMAIYKWKERKLETIFKCPNHKCPHLLKRKSQLTKEEQEKRTQNCYDPNYKLHYQFREYHFDIDDIQCNRPDTNTKNSLLRINNSLNVLGLVLSYSINLGLSSRQTKQALEGMHGIKLSHQTIINYMNLAASEISPWLDKNLPQPTSTAAADETYIIVENEWHFTWIIMDSETKAICGYNISDTRGAEPALATLINTYGKPQDNLSKNFILIRDGLTSYDNAINAYNQQVNSQIITGKAVIGLENLDDISKEYRPYKQMIERLNRTYKFHTRPRAGFKSLAGASSLTTLFVAYYNYMRPHSSKSGKTPLELKELQGVNFYPQQWLRLLKLAI